MAEDDEGVLGRLPRSRPGTRSDKRTAAKAPPPPPPRPRRPSPASPPETTSRPDPLGDAVRVATKAAGAGVRVAGTVAGELFRRLPRP